MNNKPNILIFMTDQQRADSVYPYSKAITPNLTRFAREGVCFSNAYTIAPHCCPARATFFSGLYPTEHGVWNNVEVGNALSRGLNDNVRLFTEDLHDNGYHTFYTGKWHVSSVEDPTDRGIEFYSNDTSIKKFRNMNRESVGYEWQLYHNIEDVSRKEGEIIRKGYPSYRHYAIMDNPKGDDDKLKSAINYIKKRTELLKSNDMDLNQPWFQFIGMVGPHDSYEVPKKYLDLYKLEDIQLPANFYDDLKDKPGMYQRIRKLFEQLPEEEHREAIRHYLAYCSYEDALFGKVLEAIDESGEAENTLIIFLSDHGDYMGDHGLWCKGLPCFEGAYHIPLICRWPNQIKRPGTIIDSFVTIADVMPTILETAGINISRKISGYSLVPFLFGEEMENIQHEVYTQSNGNEQYGIQRSVRTHEWKYVYNGFDQDELYDLISDPDEQINLFDKYENSDIVRELSKKMWEFAYKHGDVCVNPYILVGYAPFGPGIIFEEE